MLLFPSAKYSLSFLQSQRTALPDLRGELVMTMMHGKRQAGGGSCWQAMCPLPGPSFLTGESNRDAMVVVVVLLYISGLSPQDEIYFPLLFREAGRQTERGVCTLETRGGERAIER